MAAVIGALRVNLGADTAQFEDGLKKAGSALQGFGQMAGAVAVGNLLAKAIEKGIEALGNLVAATFRSIDALDEMGKQAQRLGMSVQAVSELSVAAALSGLSVEQLSTSISKLSKGMIEANEKGTDPLSRGLASLGISSRDINGRLKTSAQLTAEVADKFSQYKDGVEKTTVAQLIFGEAGAKMVPLLNQGSAGLQRTAEMSAKLGLVMGTEASANAKIFNENIKLVGLGLTQGIFNAIAEKVLPVLVKLSEWLLTVTVGFLNLIGVSRDTTKAIEDLGKGQKDLVAISAEAAQKAAQFREQMLKIALATSEVRGALLQFPAGFVQMAMSLGLVNKNLSVLSLQFDQLTPKAQQLFLAMRAQEQAKAVAELRTPWEAFRFTIDNLGISLERAAISQEEFILKSRKAVTDLQTIYANAASGIASAMGEMFTAIGGEQAGFVRATKIAMAVQALLSTYAGSAAALAGPFPANIAAAAVVLAKGLTLVAAIKGTPLGFAKGGSFKVPGAGGMDSQFMPMMASPGERVTVETPAQQRDRSGGQTVVLRGSSFHINEVRDLFDYINAGLGDGHKLKVVTG